ncbi:hypothetical protein ABZT28_08340 [Streptomyces sp. NPDC005388]|uniref:hypothetical protein n=1 Tax=Streptomyces sp. NPDC005388 TaxID=3156717 RepID=UPI0033A6D521
MIPLRLRVSAAGCALVLGASAALLSSSTAVAAPSKPVVRESPARQATRSAAVADTSVGPFTEPGFAVGCTWHEFGEGEQPPWWLAFTDPLCVEYSKRDITIDDGGALRFLVAEPSRFAVSMLTCHYYQKDHWSVQSTHGATPWVAWDGQYWWDKAARWAGARLTNFRIDGHSVGIGDAVAALRPVFPDLASALSDYGQAAGETGLTVSLPYDLRCALAG